MCYQSFKCFYPNVLDYCMTFGINILPLNILDLGNMLGFSLFSYLRFNTVCHLCVNKNSDVENIQLVIPNIKPHVRIKP